MVCDVLVRGMAVRVLVMLVVGCVLRLVVLSGHVCNRWGGSYCCTFSGVLYVVGRVGGSCKRSVGVRVASTCGGGSVGGRWCVVGGGAVRVEVRDGGNDAALTCNAKIVSHLARRSPFRSDATSASA